MIESVTPGDILISYTNTFWKTYLVINSQSIPNIPDPIIAGNSLQEKINEIDRDLKQFKAFVTNF